MSADEGDADMVILHSPTDDGAGVRVVRSRRGAVEVGEVRPLEEGKPIAGEVVTLTPRKDTPRVCDVSVECAVPAARSGPAQVATTAYRDHWDATFAPGSDKTLN